MTLNSNDSIGAIPGLEPKAAKALVAAGFRDIGDLVGIFDSELLGVKWIGQEALLAIRTVVSKPDLDTASAAKGSPFEEDNKQCGPEGMVQVRATPRHSLAVNVLFELLRGGRRPQVDLADHAVEIADRLLELLSTGPEGV